MISQGGKAMSAQANNSIVPKDVGDKWNPTLWALLATQILDLQPRKPF